MKTKPCALCTQPADLLYRVKLTEGKVWQFVCKACISQAQTLSSYQYGGTWNGKRH